MCSFKDMNGLDLEVGDAVEFWSAGYQAWRPGKVVEKQTKMGRKYDQLTGKWTDFPETNIKTTATPNRIKSPKNIRKVV